MAISRKSAIASADADPRWAAVVTRDPRADGRFYFAVKTTGVYCRPSCAARRANPRNVSFFPTAAAAEAAGFRPCKRCRPAGPGLAAEHARAVARACRIIESAEDRATTAALATSVGLSVFHFHRVFKAATGLTPRAYAAAHRALKLRESLPKSQSESAAAIGAGFSTAGRFYEKSDEILGMAPRAYRRGGAGAEIRYALRSCALGLLLVAASETGICAISLGDEPRRLVGELKRTFPSAKKVEADAAFAAVLTKVVAFVEQPALGLDLPLDIRGTAFQERVWRALREIPAGSSLTYTALARHIGAPAAVRAVASACAANTLAVAVPCHRVIRKSGALAGYRWGLARKRALLQREAGVSPPTSRVRKT